jgi:catechol 2,3-dioxygenase-like lactoylglutathione lyase family enzyme
LYERGCGPFGNPLRWWTRQHGLNSFYSNHDDGQAGSGGRWNLARKKGERTMRKQLQIGVAAALAAFSLAGLAHADAIPGMRGHDHTGITVPNMEQAVDFFTNVVGCEKAMAFGPFADDKGTFMTDLVGVDAKAVIKQITQVRCGYGSNIELFEYTAPDQRDLNQKNSDIGAFHIALYVDDVAIAKAYLDKKGIKTRMGPVPIQEGPAAGQTILYFQAPWGLQLEAISYPKGMAYEKTSTVKLWDPKNPAQ